MLLDGPRRRKNAHVRAMPGCSRGGAPATGNPPETWAANHARKNTAPRVRETGPVLQIKQG
eukprot:3395375-Pyramimonas_sp.AAC.1